MLVIPLAHEQPLQAHLVERCGVGVHMPLGDVNADRCRSALLQLMAPGPHREQAARIRRSYAETDAATQIVGWLTQLARREPIPAT
jgi:UDP:flavonoid glycosyltransferase YjiC (YdhE family)